MIINNKAWEKFSRNEISQNGTTGAISHRQSSHDPQYKESLIRGKMVHTYIYSFNKTFISARSITSLCKLLETQ